MNHDDGETNLSNPPRPDRTPWLAYAKPESGIQIFCTTTPLHPHNKSYVKSIPQLCNNTIIGSAHDWLILQDCNNKHLLSLYNPVTLQAIHDLPPLPDWAACNQTRTGGTLTFPPDYRNPRACVLFVYCGTQAFLCRPTAENPTWFCFDNNRVDVRCDPVVLNGIIYFWASYNDLPYLSVFIQLDVADYESNILHSIPWFYSKPVEFIVEGVLIESCGRIYSVPEPYSYNCIKVWELDFQSKCWWGVKCLDGRAFFIGPSCSTWCWGTTDDPESKVGVHENSLYFTANDHVEDSVYSCRLDNGCVTFLGPCPNSPINFGAKRDHDSLVWFMPYNQRSLEGQERRLKAFLAVIIAAQQKEEKQIISRVDDILRKLADITIRSVLQVLPQRNLTANDRLCQLPSEIIYLIAKNLPLFDYRNFRATCKMFRAAFYPKPEWRVPFFIFCKNYDRGLFEVKDPRQYDSCSSYLGSFYPSEIVASSKNGWLLIKNNLKRSLHLVNVFTNMRFDSEQHNIEGRFIIFGFSTLPASPDCVIVGYCCAPYIGDDEHDSILYLCSSEGRWKHCILDTRFDRYPSIIYHKGAFYFMDELGYLGVFKLVGQEASWSFYGKQVNINEAHFRPESNHLVECDGDLLSVFLGVYIDNSLELTSRGGAEVSSMKVCSVAGIKVFKCNSLKENWVEVGNIGNYSLFIGPTSFSAVAKEHEMRNRIYLPKIIDNRMIYYNLETNKFYSVGKEESLDNFSYTVMPAHCCWV